MTALERTKRRFQKAAFINRKSPVTKRFFIAARKRSTATHHYHHGSGGGSSLSLFERHRRPWQRFLRRRKSSMNEPLDPIEVRLTTYRLMQAEVWLRINQGNGRSCTLFDAIEAIKSSQDIMKSHAYDPADSLCGLLWRNARGEETPVKRQYALMGVLDDVEARPSACEDRVTSWEDVEEALREHMNFPTEGSTEGEEDFSDNPVERMKQRIERDSQEKTKQQLDSVRPRPPPATELALERAQRSLLGQFASENEEVVETFEDEGLRVSEGDFLHDDRETEAEERAAQLLRILTPEEEDKVRIALFDIGPEEDVIAKLDTDFVTRKNMHTLQDGQWLSDEIIHFYLALLAKRDEELCLEDTTRKRSHFFKSFFMTKLMNEGHSNPSIAGTYEYKNVKRWSKKVPGKDIFALDKIIFPINVGEVHWVCACAFMQEKRIQYYDSFGGDGLHYLESIKRYIEDEHMDKKKMPLPFSEDWTLVTCRMDTPRQKNGYDCGVFTCMFADFLSKDCPLVFGQDHVNQCRNRIALSILEGRAFM